MCAPRVIEDEDYDELVSNDEYIVIDGKDVNRLVEDMVNSGRDDVEITEQFLEAAERLNGESRRAENGKVGTKKPHGEGELANTMEYFTERNISLMPRWAADAYRKGEHDSLFGSDEMFAAVERKALERITNDQTREIDYSATEIAADYNVPVEFVIDMMAEFGVSLPIDESQGIRNRLGEDRIVEMQRILMSHDSYDLGDRYSDRSLAELCEVYNIDEDEILDVCQRESIYPSRGLQTRLQLTREDGVLEVALGRQRTGAPYPSILEGL